jgi:D-3-phosphoglycerate dehydrogenase / 2-oxoglutarate reductase
VKILVTCPPMLNHINEFNHIFNAYNLEGIAAQVKQVMTEDKLIEIIPKYDGWIIGDDPATEKVFKAGKKGNLKAAVKWGVGVDNVDFNACKELNIPIVNTPGVFGREVADVATAYLLALARETHFIDRKIRLNNEWPKPSGVSLWNKKVGVVGFGDIGKATAKRLLASELKVIAYDPFYKKNGSDLVDLSVWPDRLNELDFIVFTCPLTTATQHMFNDDILSLLKPGVRVINVSRGSIINESSLIKGLDRGIVHSAALDVFEREPLPIYSKLRAYERCIFGSHNGSNTIDAVRYVSKLSIEIIANFLNQK